MLPKLRQRKFQDSTCCKSPPVKVSTLVNTSLIISLLQFVHVGDKPDLYHLEHFEVIKKVAADWQTIAIHLGLQPEVVRIIHHDTAYFGCETSCRETFRRWLAGEGSQLVTWETLIKVLEDAEKSKLAKELEKHLHGQVSVHGYCTSLLIDWYTLYRSKSAPFQLKLCALLKPDSQSNSPQLTLNLAPLLTSHPKQPILNSIRPPGPLHLH